MEIYQKAKTYEKYRTRENLRGSEGESANRCIKAVGTKPLDKHSSKSVIGAGYKKNLTVVLFKFCNKQRNNQKTADAPKRFVKERWVDVYRAISRKNVI